MARRHALTSLLLVPALLAAGCFGRSEVDGRGLQDRAAGEPCRQDANCRLGLTCVQQTCVELGPAPAEPEPDARPLPNPGDCPGVAGTLTLGGEVDGDTTGKPNRYAATCGGGEAPEELWLLELTSDSRVLLSTEGSDFDTVLYVRSNCDDGAEATCEDDIGADTVIVDLTAGTWLVYVDGFSEAGAYTLQAQLLPQQQ